MGTVEDQADAMPRKSRVVRKVDETTRKIADMINAEVAARLGPDATFEQEQDMAAAVAVKVRARLAQERAGKAGT